MNVNEIKKELAELRKKIKYHSKKYFEFDLLMNILKKIKIFLQENVFAS